MTSAVFDSSKLDSCADYAMKRAAERAAKSYQGPVTVDRFGRKVPKSAGRVDWFG